MKKWKIALIIVLVIVAIILILPLVVDFDTTNKYKIGDTINIEAENATLKINSVETTKLEISAKPELSGDWYKINVTYTNNGQEEVAIESLVNANKENANVFSNSSEQLYLIELGLENFLNAGTKVKAGETVTGNMYVRKEKSNEKMKFIYFSTAGETPAKYEINLKK